LPTTACWFIEASTVLVQATATNFGVQFFGSTGLPCSQVHCAMRKSRQPRGTAAVSIIAAADVPKLLEGRQNSR